ncbi:YfhO family protein [Kribbella sp. NPDC056951]|uniref:YfhO family protein n=1 Tax=Kribbella sp. NPDC056951 TaxID=3345978 RepID=UPI003633F260
MRARRYWPAMVAGAAASATFVLSGIIRGTYPFGDRTRSTNDLGQQFIPMAAHLRDVVTGQAAGDLVFNWQSGFGVPFVGDFMAYIGSTLSWIAFVLPRDRIDLALFLIATAAIGIGAGAMTAYLRMIRPSGPVWIAVAAGASYGACSWSIDDAAYMTIWLSGMVAFPVLCLLCEWILQKRSIAAMVVTPIVVALLWTSHFYTVYMATIGAGIVTLARLLTTSSTWRDRLTGGVRCVVAVALGIGLAAPLLVPTFALVKAATPSPPQEFQRAGMREFLSRLLAGTEGVGTSPSFAVGTVMLLLALSFPFNRAIAVRQRLVWTLTVVLTVVSMQVTFTHRAWHGFDTPQGSSYRQAFVIAGMLVILGWMSASEITRSRSLVISLAPPVLVLGLYVWTRDVRHITPTTRVVVPVLIGVAVVAWWFSRSPGRLRWGAVAILIAAVLAEVTVSSVAIDAARYPRLSNAAFWGADHEQVRSLVQSMDDWPRHRTSPGQTLTFNDPMLVGGQGSQYYSSTIPHTTSRALIALGFGYTSYGRALYDPENPVVDAVFAIRGRVIRGPKLVTQDAVAPLVTIRPASPWKSSDPGPYGVQETALGADVYTVPPVSPLKIEPGATASLVASCQPGAEVYLTAPQYVDLLIDGTWKPTLRDRRPGIYSGAPVTRVGTADTSGNVRVDIKAHQRTTIPSGALACLDRTRLTAAVRDLTESAPGVVDVGGHAIRIQRLPGRAATVAVAVISIKGWRCSVDGRPTTPISHAGLLTVAVGPRASEVACTYRPPGTRLGLAAGAGSLAALLFLTALLTWHRRRAASRHDESR